MRSRTGSGTGYGINEAIIRQAAADGVDTLVTCDNGIAAAKEISLAKELGMTVVVTDHHEVPVEEERQVLPPADVVVDPKQGGRNVSLPGYLRSGRGLQAGGKAL